MQKITVALLLVFFQSVIAQTETKIDSLQAGDFAVHSMTSIEFKPTFPGGMPAFYQYIANNFHLPKKRNLTGKVFVTFVIERDGTVADVKVLRDIGYGTGEEAKRVIENSPKWNPGMQNDQPVRVQYALPITINTR